jgi:hypothetical protein
MAAGRLRAARFFSGRRRNGGPGIGNQASAGVISVIIGNSSDDAGHRA